MRHVTRLFLSGILAIALAGVASAAVHVRLAVSPAEIAQCSQATVLTSLENGGTAPISVKLGLTLSRADTVLFGPVYGRTALAAGETRTRELSFVMPPVVPPGSYQLVLTAQASDGSSDSATAPFTVLSATGPCPPPPPGTNAGTDLLDGVIGSTGATVDSPLPVTPSTWGSLKLLYR